MHGKDVVTTDRRSRTLDEADNILWSSWNLVGAVTIKPEFGRRECSARRRTLLFGIPIDETALRNVQFLLILVENARQWRRTLYYCFTESDWHQESDRLRAGSILETDFLTHFARLYTNCYFCSYCFEVARLFLLMNNTSGSNITSAVFNWAYRALIADHRPIRADAVASSSTENDVFAGYIRHLLTSSRNDTAKIIPHKNIVINISE